MIRVPRAFWWTLGAAALLSFVVLGAGLVFLSYIGLPTSSPVSSSARVERGITPTERDDVENLQFPKDKGLVTSIDTSMNEVRVNGGLWLPLTADVKRNIVMVLSRHMEHAGRTGRVKVLTTTNDAVLAEYSVWTGVVLHQ